jgi:hypothetical protein
MDFNPEDARQYLEGAEYPASKEDLISAAEGNDAPEALLDRSRTLGRKEFSGPEEVVEELRASPTAICRRTDLRKRDTVSAPLSTTERRTLRLRQTMDQSFRETL